MVPVAARPWQVSNDGTRYRWTVTFHHPNVIGRAVTRLAAPLLQRTIADQNRTLTAWLDENPERATTAELRRMDRDRYLEAERRLFDHVGIEPTQRCLHLQRIDVKVRILEAGGGPPILFIHGATNSGASWTMLIQRLERFRCIALDRPGCGLSDPLPATLDGDGLPVHGNTLVVDVLDALDLPSAHVVSTSMGGYFALRAAATHPDRIDRIVQLGWTLGAPTPPLPAIMRLASPARRRADDGHDARR